MKDELMLLLHEKEGYNAKLNTMREYLQAFILRILFKNNFFRHAAFLGGTCLRFVYSIKRFSEDLDFSLQKEQDFHFEKIVDTLSGELEDSGYQVAAKIKIDGVYSAMIKFSGLLWEAGMSHREEENFSIKIEVDRRPPRGNRTESRIITKYFMSGIACFDLSTLFAGKINAVLTRNYVKGRDYYDLFWYLTVHKGTQPNIEFLKNALAQ
ncbi:MAG: nucleotidyl transferase AbiEii/AbiGii toxin family protein, partial [bacterium]|nr:nucleotidyl transferase AbiEii/AbiGii toxin family protein [bacterium]